VIDAAMCEGVYEPRWLTLRAAGAFTPTCEFDLLVAVGERHHGAAVTLADADIGRADLLEVDLEHPPENLAAAVGHVGVDAEDGPGAVTLDLFVQQGQRVSGDRLQGRTSPPRASAMSIRSASPTVANSRASNSSASAVVCKPVAVAPPSSAL